MSDRRRRPSTAILIPCYNEEHAIADVVADFRRELPGADIYVYDNNSSDNTIREARRAGAIVRSEPRQGKGFVVQSMFRDIDADLYLLIDGDGTYPASAVHALIAPVLENRADMVVGSRLHAQSNSRFTFLHRLGNKLFRRLLNAIFDLRLTDILSGYRAFNRQFVKGIPLFGGGFEIEAELTIKGVSRGDRLVEVPVDLTDRREGSLSKIRLVSDGLVILQTILALFRDYKPLTFFGSVGLALMFLGGVAGYFPLRDTLANIQPSLLVEAAAAGLTLAGVVIVALGLVLHTIARRSQEFEYHLRIIAGELMRERDMAPRDSFEGRGEPVRIHAGS